MANGYLVKTPQMAHELAAAMGRDAANQSMRKAGRSKWNRADANVAAETTQRWYSNFGILSADAWMPEGYEWRSVNGDYVPARKATCPKCREIRTIWTDGTVAPHNAIGSKVTRRDLWLKPCNGEGEIPVGHSNA